MKSGSLKKLWIPAIALAVIGCGGQRGQKQTIDQETGDTLPPQFIVQPTIATRSASSAEMIFSFNENANVALVIRPDSEFQLTNSQVEKADDRQSLKAKSFETIRVAFSDLNSGQTYKIFLTMQDSKGNIISKPVVTEFQTNEIGIYNSLSGSPPPAKQGVLWHFKPTGLRDDCKLNLIEGPEWLRVLPNGNAVGGVPKWHASRPPSDFTLSVEGNQCQGQGTFPVKVSGDPLFEFAWHMNPTAVAAFSWFSSPKALSINLDQVRAMGLTGLGVNITVVDSGMQIDHPDLKPNIDMTRNINLDPLLSVGCQVCDSKNTSPPLVPGEQGNQGTAVAGIIGAVGWNGIGARGIAPQSKLSAYNLSAPRFTTVSDNDYLRIFSIATDVVCHSASAGAEILSEQPDFNFDAYDLAQRSKTRVGRDGLGIIYLKASGDLAEKGGNAAFDQRNATSWGMIVGSHNILGRKSTTSSPGANVWISAPGGEAGFQSDYEELEIKPPVINFYPGIVAPDIFNAKFPCSVGYAKSPKYFQSEADVDPKVHSVGHSSGFNLGWHELNQDCQYTATLPSSAAATGVAAGAVALLLEANPKLTWRDVKYIIAKTAKPIDANISSEITSIRGSQYEKTLPWVSNAGGFKFHNSYGFGALDIAAAVKVANPNSYRTLPPLFDTNWVLAASPFLRIPAASIAGAFSDFFEVYDILIESVQVRVNISHPDASHIGIELVSPNGTRSILKSIKDGSRFDGIRNMVFLSNAFYGERSRGNWQLRVVDGKEGQTPGHLNNWSIRVTGQKQTGE